MENTLLLMLPVVAALAVVAPVPYVVARRRRRRATAAALTWISTLTVAPTTFAATREPVPAGNVPSAGESLQVRTLRCQVRSLEEALTQEQRLGTEQSATENLDDYRRRVHAVIRAMGGHVQAEERAPEVLARVSAAIDRLDVQDPFTRPTLSVAAAQASGAPGASLRAQQVPPSAEVVEAERRAVTAAAAAEAAAPAADAAGDSSEAVSASTPEVVLPVPPMAESTDNRRGRRWMRGRAA